MNTDLNSKLTRCPRLGQEITFSYCRQESGELPCARIIGCWQPVFDVEVWLQKEMKPELWQKFINYEPKDKVVSIIDLIAQARAGK